MPGALKHTRRMRGGAQPQPVRCSDGGYYFVKSLDNPYHHHPRVLASEWLASLLVEVENLSDFLGERVLDEAASSTPPEWYNFEQDAFNQLLEQLSAGAGAYAI